MESRHDYVELPWQECFVAFVRLFLGRLTTYHEGNRRALSYIRRAQAAAEEASLHLGKKGGLNRGRVVEAAITELQTLEAVVTQEGGSEGIEEGELSEVGASFSHLCHSSAILQAINHCAGSTQNWCKLEASSVEIKIPVAPV